MNKIIHYKFNRQCLKTKSVMLRESTSLSNGKVQDPGE